MDIHPHEEPGHTWAHWIHVVVHTRNITALSFLWEQAWGRD